MATGKAGVNGRMNCSVCLEPFRGRQPKLLPCFHTFCLPCLTKLADEGKHAKPKVSTQSSGFGDKSTVSIACPTCRQVIPVPSGDAKNFQTNFYLEDCDQVDSAEIVLCDLCNGEEAQYQCTQCHSSFCIYCQRYHSSTCQGAQVTALQNPSGNSGQVTALQSTSGNSSQALQRASDTGNTAQGSSSNQVPEQVGKVEDCVKKLREDKEKLGQEREAMENSMHLRYAALLRHVGDAHNRGVNSLRQVCDDLAEQLDTNLTEAQQTLDSLQQQMSGGQRSSVSQAQQRAEFVQGDLQTILLNTASADASLLRHETEDNLPQLTDCLQSFMGKVVKNGCQDTDTTQIKEVARLNDKHSDQELMSPGEATPTSPHAPTTSAWEGICQKVDVLTNQVSSLQASNKLLTQHVNMLSRANSTLSSEQTSLQRELIAAKDKSSRMMSDQAALHREVTGLKDKNSIVHQDLAVQNAERDNMRAQLDKLQKEVVTAQTECSTLKSDTKKDLDQLKAQFSILKSDVKKDHDRLESELSTLKSDVKKDVNQLKTECSTLKSDTKRDIDQLNLNLSGIQSSISIMKSNHLDLQSDQNLSKNQMACLQQELKSAQTSLQDGSQQIATLKSRITNSQVAFCALLDKEVTINCKQETLICRAIISRIGDGYDENTGVFTAPLSGTYCFMVNTGVCIASQSARLDIVLEDCLKGYVCTSGNSMATGHTVVKMNAGQRVWLRTYGDDQYTFRSEWWTYFSGMLLQPDV